ncbi:hypothetical protein VB776_07950 [Arcicella sp. DC2W]|uniref:Uncharacterized protein n=1 Tax=Arcicella gelida TaxID=2984195 RepID=A0ABU5S3N5_9BACT|nr:hypothetical protein [Arcicella sp. DC2W]MEA5402843.1 hypothetical protein [Arcicella sp. DC2W]
MTYLKFITGLLLITLSTSRQTSSVTNTKSLEINREYPSYIIFGIFCGECSGHCSTMYRYNMMGNSNTLFIDTTDSYFKNYGKVVCKTQINDITKFQTINKLVQHIPKTFLTTDKKEQTFGCPDCGDWCGIYFELGQGTTIKKFYIDYKEDELGKEVKDFGEFIKAAITELNKQN